MEQFTKTIHKALNKYHQVCERTCQALEKVTEIKVFNENELIEKEKEKCNAEFIVLDGIIKAYLVNQKGDEITVNFFTNNMAITPTIMRSLDDIAFYNLQVLSKKATLLVFNKKGMFVHMQNYADLEQFGPKVMMIDAMQRIERELILLKSNGKEKLEWFRKRFPNLENSIQHYHIASFLGMTSTSLSRIRGKK
jgi:hypothetical protein